MALRFNFGVVLMQRFNKQFGQDVSVLRTHIDARMDTAVLLPELDQELEFIVANLKKVRVSAFLSARTSAGLTTL
jgi:hypothetical protein